MKLKTLFSPEKIGNVQIKNRIVRSATYVRRAEKYGSIGDQLIDFYKELAKGGTGLIIPEMLCSLDQLEVIRFPNNLIKKIPEWITKLKLLRVLDVSNVDQPNPFVPDSIKPFIESLESFNEFYR